MFGKPMSQVDIETLTAWVERFRQEAHLCKEQAWLESESRSVYITYVWFDAYESLSRLAASLGNTVKGLLEQSGAPKAD